MSWGQDEQGTGGARPAGPAPDGDSPALRESPPSGSPAGQAPAGADSTRTPPADSSGEQAVEEDLAALLADAHRERDEYLDLAKRTKADFENFRKRMSGEVQGAAVRGKSEVVREVVPVLDDLERAIEAAGLDPEGDSEDGFAHGVILVFRGLRDTLARAGVEVVDPQGEKFDPMAHEALSTLKVEGAESGTVVEVMQKGYRLGEQLVRPARVVVSE